MFIEPTHIYLYTQLYEIIFTLFTKRFSHRFSVLNKIEINCTSRSDRWKHFFFEIIGFKIEGNIACNIYIYNICDTPIKSFENLNADISTQIQTY